MTFRSWMISTGLLTLALSGCGKPPAVTTDTAHPDRETEKPWTKAVSILRKENDPATCRRVLTDLTTAATAAESSPLPALTDADRKELQTIFGLKEDEVKEISGAGFTGLDAIHLAECFYLRDVANTLDASKLPPVEKAQRVMSWVCRQIQRVPVGTVVPAPASWTLRRGSGGGLDRATVFVAICRQLDLDAFLVGTKSANEWPPPNLPKDAALSEPFWGVAIRDGNKLYLFDPLRGLPFPGATPGKPATLAEAQANPDLFKPWATDGKGVLPTAEVIKSSTPFLAISLSAFTPRMMAFQELTGNDLGVRVAVNYQAISKAVSACGTTLSNWVPTHFPVPPIRSLREYIPVADGGASSIRTAWTQDYVQKLFPKFSDQLAASLAKAEPNLRDRLYNTVTFAYRRALLENAPRERLQRGMYLDVTQALVRIREEFRTLQERSTTDPSARATANAWLNEMNDLERRLGVAKLDAQTNGGDSVQKIEAELQKRWGDKFVEMLVGNTLGEPVLGEATYLLALTKHEQAERAQYSAGQGASEATAARAAWAEANGWWQRYLPLAPAQDQVFPGRAAHVQILVDRAASFK